MILPFSSEKTFLLRSSPYIFSAVSSVISALKLKAFLMPLITPDFFPGRSLTTFGLQYSAQSMSVIFTIIVSGVFMSSFQFLTNVIFPPKRSTTALKLLKKSEPATPSSRTHSRILSSLSSYMSPDS